MLGSKIHKSKIHSSIIVWYLILFIMVDGFRLHLCMTLLLWFKVPTRFHLFEEKYVLRLINLVWQTEKDNRHKHIQWKYLKLAVILWIKFTLQVNSMHTNSLGSIEIGCESHEETSYRSRTMNILEKKVNNSYFCDTNQDGETIHFIGWIIEQNDWMKKIVCCLIWPDTKTEKNGNKIEQEEEAGNSNVSISNSSFFLFFHFLRTVVLLFLFRPQK